jgi:SAM-dependent methyltransferase
LRVPTSGVRYLEQARRQLFARHPDYLPFLVRHLGVHPGMTVVDVGCGTGVYTRILASRLHDEGRAIGVDVHPAVVEHAHAMTQAEGWGNTVEYMVGDATALPLPDASADVVFCNSLLWLLPDPAAALRDMRRVLRPGGRALAAEPDGGLVHSFDPHRPRLSELEQRFQACYARGCLLLDGHDYEIGRKLPGLFIISGFVAVRTYPRLFVAAGCDLGDDPQAGLVSRVEEYEQALDAMRADTSDVRAQREHRAQRARAGGMSDEELTEHERATIEYLEERVANPVRILTDGSVYMYGGVLCEGMRFDDLPPGPA